MVSTSTEGAIIPRSILYDSATVRCQDRGIPVPKIQFTIKPSKGSLQLVLPLLNMQVLPNRPYSFNRCMGIVEHRITRRNK